MPGLALLFELADLASFEGFDGSSLAEIPNLVSLEQYQASGGMVRVPGIARSSDLFLRCEPRDARRAQELAAKIKRRAVGAGGFFSCRDVYVKGWSGLDTPESVRKGAEILKDAGWVRELPSESGPLGGRPSSRYEINPRLWE